MKQMEALQNGERVSHILPFVWMKGEENSVIKEELDRIESCGIREVCLEARPHPDYCGPGWWKNVDFVMEEAEKRGMRVWILDDDKFPTGHCNGAFETRCPEKKKVYLAERHMDIMGPCRDSAVLVENFMQPDGALLAVLACPKPDGETLDVSSEGILDLTENVKNGFVYFDLPKGPYRLFVLFTTQNGGGRPNYMNLIDSDSVHVLIEEVYEKHYERYQKYAGSTFAGFFSDEPELGNINGYPFDAGLGKRDVRLPWSRQLETRLRAQWKDSFVKSLPALWYGMGENTKTIRSQYMEHLTDLVYKCFSGQLGSWCQAHDLEYIGHIIEDDNAHTRLACSIGHYFKEMKGQHMAGIDVVHHQIVPGFTEKIHQWIAGDADGEFFHYGLAKLGSSAAHLDPEKKGRALCEIFGNYGWAEGVSLMTWLTNHMLVRGINEFTPHAFALSYPDRDCPPHFYARGNNPQFEAFAELMQYMNRAAHLLSVGKPVLDAAILYHAQAEWSGGKTMFFQKPMRELMEHQLDADVLPAEALTDSARIIAHQLVVNGNSYGCLILPYAQYLMKEAAEFAVEAAAKGLPVIVVDALPEGTTDGEALPENFQEVVNVIALAKLSEFVNTVVTAQLHVSAVHPALRFLGREDDEAFVYMFFNESVSEQIRTEVTFENWSGKNVKLYDPWNNQSVAFAVEGKLSLCLEPGEAKFVILEKKAAAEELEAYPRRRNWRSLDLDWTLSEKTEGDWDSPDGFTVIKTIAAGDTLPNLNGRSENPEFTGIGRYEGQFSMQKIPGCHYQLLLPEAGDVVKVSINGRSFGYLTHFPGRVNITDALKDGMNELTLEAVTTLVWKRKDGASTHLQVYATGILQKPVLEEWN